MAQVHVEEVWAMRKVVGVATVASVTAAETVQEVMAKVAAVEACEARMDCTEVGERAPEATEREVAAEGETAQQRVERGQEELAKAVVVAVEMVQETLEAG